MHTTNILKSSDFQFFRDARKIDRSEVLPAITKLDRLGVVMHQPDDGLHASNFILACVTTFYDCYRETDTSFLTYPDFFTFQATKTPAEYSSLDIWPSHKNVQVDRDPEKILQAVNDRGVNMLLVPIGPSSPHPFDEISLSSARRRIRACYLYSPKGRLKDAEFSIRRRTDIFQSHIFNVIMTIKDATLRKRRKSAWARRLDSQEWTVEDYRGVPLEEALTYVSP